MSKKLYVGNLSFEISEEDLKELFEQAGTVESAVIVEDRETGRSRGFAFVEMATPQEAGVAVRKLDGRPFKGRNLKVDVAHELGGGHGSGDRP